MYVQKLYESSNFALWCQRGGTGCVSCSACSLANVLNACFPDTDGAENVESTAIGKAMPPGTRVYGCFAHGELGPTNSFTEGFPTGPNAIPCTQHSMTSILSLHTEPN